MKWLHNCWGGDYCFQLKWWSLNLMRDSNFRLFTVLFLKNRITMAILLAIQMHVKTTVWQCKLTLKSISWTASAAVSWLNPFGALLIGQTAGKRTLLVKCGMKQRWWGSWACLRHHTTPPLTKLSRAGGCRGQAAFVARFWQGDEWTCDRLKALAGVALPQTLLLGLCVTQGGGMISNHQHSTQ